MSFAEDCAELILLREKIDFSRESEDFLNYVWDRFGFEVYKAMWKIVRHRIPVSVQLHILSNYVDRFVKLQLNNSSQAPIPCDSRQVVNEQFFPSSYPPQTPVGPNNAMGFSGGNNNVYHGRPGRPPYHRNHYPYRKNNLQILKRRSHLDDIYYPNYDEEDLKWQRSFGKYPTWYGNRYRPHPTLKQIQGYRSVHTRTTNTKTSDKVKCDNVKSDIKVCSESKNDDFHPVRESTEKSTVTSLPRDKKIAECLVDNYSDLHCLKGFKICDELDSDQETVCLDENISIDQIDTLKSYLRPLPLRDNHDVVDMDISPGKRKVNDTEPEEDTAKKTKYDRMYFEINSDKLLNKINEVLMENEQTVSAKKTRSKSLSEDRTCDRFRSLVRSRSLETLNGAKCSVSYDFDLKTNLLLLLKEHNTDFDVSDGFNKILTDLKEVEEVRDKTEEQIVTEKVCGGVEKVRESQEIVAEAEKNEIPVEITEPELENVSEKYTEQESEVRDDLNLPKIENKRKSSSEGEVEIKKQCLNATENVKETETDTNDNECSKFKTSTVGDCEKESLLAIEEQLKLLLSTEDPKEHDINMNTSETHDLNLEELDKKICEPDSACGGEKTAENLSTEEKTLDKEKISEEKADNLQSDRIVPSRTEEMETKDLQSVSESEVSQKIPQHVLSLKNNESAGKKEENVPVCGDKSETDRTKKVTKKKPHVAVKSKHKRENLTSNPTQSKHKKENLIDKTKVNDAVVVESPKKVQKKPKYDPNYYEKFQRIRSLFGSDSESEMEEQLYKTGVKSTKTTQTATETPVKSSKTSTKEPSKSINKRRCSVPTDDRSAKPEAVNKTGGATKCIEKRRETFPSISSCGKQPKADHKPKDPRKEHHRYKNKLHKECSKETEKSSKKNMEKSQPKPKQAIQKCEEIESLQCSPLNSDRFPTMQRAGSTIQYDECCDTTVVLETVEVATEVEIVKQQAKDDDIIEVKPNIPVIDLTEDVAKPKKEPREEKQAGFKSENETITLYRSEETINDSLEVQVTSESILPRVLPNWSEEKTTEKVSEVQNSTRNVSNSVPQSFSVCLPNRSEENTKKNTENVPEVQNSTRNVSNSVSLTQMVPQSTFNVATSGILSNRSEESVKKITEKVTEVQNLTRNVLNSLPLTQIVPRSTFNIATSAALLNWSEESAKKTSEKVPEVQNSTSAFLPNCSKENTKKTVENVSEVQNSTRNVSNSVPQSFSVATGAFLSNRSEENTKKITEKVPEVQSVTRNVSNSMPQSISAFLTNWSEENTKKITEKVPEVQNSTRNVSNSMPQSISAFLTNWSEENTEKTTEKVPEVQNSTRNVSNSVPLTQIVPQSTFNVATSAGNATVSFSTNSVPQFTVHRRPETTQIENRFQTQCVPPKCVNAPISMLSRMLNAPINSYTRQAPIPARNPPVSVHSEITIEELKRASVVLAKYVHFFHGLKRAEAAFTNQVSGMSRYMLRFANGTVMRFNRLLVEEYARLCKELARELKAVNPTGRPSSVVHVRTVMKLVFETVEKLLPDVTTSWFYLTLEALMKPESAEYKMVPFLDNFYGYVSYVTEKIRNACLARDPFTPEQRRLLEWQIRQYQSLRNVGTATTQTTTGAVPRTTWSSIPTTVAKVAAQIQRQRSATSKALSQSQNRQQVANSSNANRYPAIIQRLESQKPSNTNQNSHLSGGTYELPNTRNHPNVNNAPPRTYNEAFKQSLPVESRNPSNGNNSTFELPKSLRVYNFTNNRNSYDSNNGSFSPPKSVIVRNPSNDNGGRVPNGTFELLNSLEAARNSSSNNRNYTFRLPNVLESQSSTSGTFELPNVSQAAQNSSGNNRNPQMLRLQNLSQAQSPSNVSSGTFELPNFPQAAQNSTSSNGNVQIFRVPNLSQAQYSSSVSSGTFELPNISEAAQNSSSTNRNFRTFLSQAQTSTNVTSGTFELPNISEAAQNSSSSNRNFRTFPSQSQSSRNLTSGTFELPSLSEATNCSSGTGSVFYSNVGAIEPLNLSQSQNSSNGNLSEVQKSSMSETLPLSLKSESDSEQIQPNSESDNSIVLKTEKSDSKIWEMETIDLTWIDDIDPEQLQSEIEWVDIKKEEIIEEESKLEKRDEELLAVAPSPADSGISSPPVQVEYDEMLFSNRSCICGRPAEYICGCMMAMYCSEQCQLEDWSAHRDICMKHNGKSGKEGSQVQSEGNNNNKN